MLFSNTSTSPIGLDISDLSLKLVQLNKSGDKIRIQALGKADLPAGYFDNGEIKNKEGIVKAIRTLVANPKFGKVSSDEVVACLPETKTFVKLIEAEKTPDNMPANIEIEIGKHVPMPLEEIYYDWQVISELPGRQLILVGAAPKSIVNQYTDLIYEAKLSPVALEIEPVAIARSLLAEEHYKFKGEKNKNYGIIDIGAKRTSMTVYSKNSILFSLSMPISGEEITKDIATALDIEIEQAEKAKIICGLDEEKARGIIKKILAGMIGELIEKINEAIGFYDSHWHERGPLDKIILCGGGANVKNLDKIIGEAIKIETKIGDPLVNLGGARKKFATILEETHSLNINLSKKEKKEEILSITQDTSAAFTTAIGMALRGIFIEEL